MRIRQHLEDGTLVLDLDSTRGTVRTRVGGSWLERPLTAEEQAAAAQDDAAQQAAQNEATIDTRLDAARAALDASVEDARAFATTTPPAFNAGAANAVRLAALEAAVEKLQGEARKAARRDVRFARALQALARKALRSFAAIEADDGSA